MLPWWGFLFIAFGRTLRPRMTSLGPAERELSQLPTGRVMRNWPTTPQPRDFPIFAVAAYTELFLPHGGFDMAVERALISVFDKTGVLEMAKRLAALDIEILSTGGTAKLLRDCGVVVKDVSEFTGWPEMLGGRVKTLHPKVHAGLLYRRDLPEDQKQAAEHGIAPIDLVVVNLYPFEATAAKDGLTAEELIENIDIGGPTMLRSAAKNLESVTVVFDPADYDPVPSELEQNGETSLATRLELARKVFASTSRYYGD